ncbi:PIG-L deacetylase family protein [Thalassospira sp.]|uniref:PIG-L deacetylase family protein n=1 Tax=Thalassospira sp. TaxID=1912094 RepID=UPI003AA909AE
MEEILVVVAHSDDETLGMGGTIKRHVRNGDRVNIISMTDGVGARKEKDAKKRKERSISALAASEILGFSWVQMFDFDDNALDSYPLLEVVKCIEEVKQKVRPSLVYTHSSADLNIDHRVVVNAVLTAFRPQPQEGCCEIRLFEVPSATDFGSEFVTGAFCPNLHIDISNTWFDKQLALQAYEAEMREYPHTRSLQAVESLSRVRGNQVGLEMAEAFQVIRKIER